MRLVRIGLASVNTTVGAFPANTDRAIRLAHDMAADDVTLGVFQEQTIGGYPVEDLIQWQGFVDGQWTQLERFARETADLPTVFVIGVAIDFQGLRFNAVAAVAGGVIRCIVPKMHLPTYNIFYEGRTFARGVIAGGVNSVHGVPFGDLLVRFDFGTLALEVCEDLWTPEGPIRHRSYSGAELVCNVSASPYRLGVVQTRKELIATRAADHGVTIAYANAVGANDGLLFDGGGIVNQNGKQMLDAPRWQEGFAATTVDLDRTSRLRTENSTWRADLERWATTHEPLPVIDVPASEFSSVHQRAGLHYPVPASRSFFLPDETPRVSARAFFCEDLLDALALGVGDYFEKNPFFQLIGVSLSGGRDSLLTLLVAHRYVTKRRGVAADSLLRAFSMPSQHTSSTTLQAAQAICVDLGVPLEIIPIKDAYERELAAVEHMLAGAPVTEITKQNIQARIRGQRMWNWANSSAGMFLQTGNMSEKAAGYTTVGGDLMGALGVLANVPKTVVMALLDYLAETTGYDGIRQVLTSPAGPELAANQSGEDELMPFQVLDACFYLFAAEKLVPSEVEIALEAMFPELPPELRRGYVEKFTRLFLGSIFKWVQAPISLHIGNLDLDRERALQLPVVQSRAWTASVVEAPATK